MKKVDTTLFTKKLGNDLFIMQIYVDDIIFGSTNHYFCEEFGKMMASEFEMSMIGELSYFLGLQIKQMKNDTFVSKGKYIKDMLKKFGMDDACAHERQMPNAMLNTRVLQLTPLFSPRRLERTCLCYKSM